LLFGTVDTTRIEVTMATGPGDDFDPEIYTVSLNPVTVLGSEQARIVGDMRSASRSARSTGDAAPAHDRRARAGLRRGLARSARFLFVARAEGASTHAEVAAHLPTVPPLRALGHAAVVIGSWHAHPRPGLLRTDAPGW
jgi:hypothetical protein